MIDKIIKIIVATTLLLATVPFTSHAALITYEWSATCTDCLADSPLGQGPHQTVTGNIVLANYNIGDSISNENFISFYYAGPSNHIPEPFSLDTRDAGRLLSVSGMIGEDDSFIFNLQFNYGLAVSQIDYSVNFDENDQWAISIDTVDFDRGFGTTISAQAVPEPATLSFFGLGLMALALRRKNLGK